MVEYARSGVPEIELLIALNCAGVKIGGRFLPGAERALSVGSGSHADFRITGNSVNAVEFYVERQDANLVLVPGYCGRQLRLNGVAVTGPTVLGDRATIELDALTMQVRLFARSRSGCGEVIRGGLSVIPSADLPGDCFADRSCADGVSDLSRTVLVGPAAQPPRFTSSRGGEQTTMHVRIPNCDSRVPTAIVPNLTLALASSVSRECVTVGEHSSVDSSAELAPHSEVARSIPTETLGPSGTRVISQSVVEQVREIAKRSAVSIEQLVRCESSRSATGNDTPATLADGRANDRGVESTTAAVSADQTEQAAGRSLSEKKPESFIAKSEESDKGPRERVTKDAESVEGAASRRSMAATSGMRWQAPTTEYTALEMPVAKPPKSLAACPTGGRNSQQSTTTLVRLGTWARQRPVTVFALALTTGLLFALCAAIILRGNDKAVSTAAIHGQPLTTGSNLAKGVSNGAQLATSELAAPTTTAGAMHDAEPVVIKGLASDSVNDRSAKAVTNNATPKLNESIQPGALSERRSLELKAIEHLVAGRHNDALRAYEKIVETAPEVEVNHVIVRILKVRLSSVCEPNGGEIQKRNNCPELLP